MLPSSCAPVHWQTAWARERVLPPKISRAVLASSAPEMTRARIISAEFRSAFLGSELSTQQIIGREAYFHLHLHGKFMEMILVGGFMSFSHEFIYTSTRLAHTTICVHFSVMVQKNLKYKC